MVVRRTGVALLLSCLLAAGCGTAVNLARQQPESGGVVPFGGVKHDIRSIQKAAAGGGVATAHHGPGAEHDPDVARMLLCTADLPFSVIGDIVTWPYTCVYTYINQPTPYPPVEIAGPPAAPPPPVPLVQPPPVEVLPPTAPSEPLKLPNTLP